MGTDGDGDGHGDGGPGIPAPPVADTIILADLFATHCKLEFRGEYFRLVFSTEPVGQTNVRAAELIPSARIVMPPSGLMELAEAVLAFYVKRKS